MKQIVLASTSPRRIALMIKIGLPFKTYDSGFIELPYKGEDPDTYILTQTKGKALAALTKFRNSIIVTGDCGVLVEKTVLGKPKNFEDAIRMLQMLSGKSHTILTGYCVIDTDSKQEITGIEKVAVTFKKLTPEEINDYIKENDCFDKAGAYAIQTVKDRFVTNLEGDWDCALGFATTAITQAVDSLLHETVSSTK